MPSSSPPEAPHYNGQTLSPASPKPIHIPDSQTIPVLQNQADPDFNLGSAHMENSRGAQDASVFAGRDVLQVLPAQEGATPAIISSNEVYTSNELPGMQNNSVGDNTENQDQYANYPNSEPQPASPGLNESTPAHASSNNAAFASKQDLGQFSSASPQNVAENLTNPTHESHPQTDPTNAIAQGEFENFEIAPKKELTIETGNIQALLDNLIASASTAPTAEIAPASAPAPAASAAPQVASPGSAQTPISALPTPAGLPPRPPPQDEPSMHPHYTAGQSIRSYHNPPPPNSAQSSTQQAQGSYRLPPNNAPASAVGPNGLPPPPGASFQQPTAPSQNITQDESVKNEPSSNASPSVAPSLSDSQQAVSASDQDAAYQDFLREEASYVAEGTWDRFPQGSRLFVGNLFTEKVSKRMIFDVFAKYGRLAQISMKNAYGFVQFVDPGCSGRALVAEEGTELGGRKIHLEISKPQKNTRNAGNNDKGGRNRRSKSPDYGRGGSRQNNQNQSSYGGHGRRTRDDYRPVRSPSPRGARGYENYPPRNGIDRYYGGQRSRSRSLAYGSNGRYRSRSPRGRDLDDEGSLPIPRRNPVQVPDVQIIIVDESDRTFVGYIQQSFRDRALRCDVLQLPRGVSLQAVIKRQIVEGVQAVVKIHRKSQVTGKVPLQIFDRSGGLNNVRFDEYEELDAAVAADVVVRAKHPQLHPTPQPQQYPPNQGYGQPQQQGHQFPPQHIPQHSMPQTQQPPAPTANSNPSNPLAQLDGPALQKLLGSLNQNQSAPQQYQGMPQSGQPQDLAALLSSVTRQTPQQQQSGYQLPMTPTQAYQYQNSPQQQHFPQQNPPQTNSNYVNNHALSQLLNRAQHQGSPPQQHSPTYPGVPPQQQQNVQDIMAQLAKYRQ